MNNNPLIEAPCPLCGGTGITLVRSFVKPEIRELARRLRRKGMTYREIGKKLGVKHPQSVKSMIEAKIV